MCQFRRRYSAERWCKSTMSGVMGCSPDRVNFTATPAGVLAFDGGDGFTLMMTAAGKSAVEPNRE